MSDSLVRAWPPGGRDCVLFLQRWAEWPRLAPLLRGGDQGHWSLLGWHERGACVCAFACSTRVPVLGCWAGVLVQTVLPFSGSVSQPAQHVWFSVEPVSCWEGRKWLRDTEHSRCTFQHLDFFSGTCGALTYSPAPASSDRLVSPGIC